jgi:hypothetical protein
MCQKFARRREWRGRGPGIFTCLLPRARVLDGRLVATRPEPKPEAAAPRGVKPAKLSNLSKPNHHIMTSLNGLNQANDGL